MSHYSSLPTPTLISSSTIKTHLTITQYDYTKIHQFETTMGSNFMSAGGLSTTIEYCSKLNLKGGEKILDIGCGIGGSAFYLAEEFNCKITAVDISTSSLTLASQRLSSKYPNLKNNISFTEADVLNQEYDDSSFDVVYSRDAILHLPFNQKKILFEKIRKWLKPGGQVLISDYGTTETPTTEFKEYAKKRGYHLYTPKGYASALSSCGFKVIGDTDYTLEYCKISLQELNRIKTGPGKLKFVEEFGEEALTDIHRVYEDKINMCLTDSRTFCVVHAFNPRNFDDERRQVLETCKEMFKSGLVLGTDGNISMRIGDDHIAIKGSGLPYETLGVEGIVVCDLEGKAISGEVYKPSSEINLHLGLYKSRSDFTSIVHCHSKSSSAVACTRKPLPCFHYSIGELTEGMEIPCAEYATYGTEVLADNVVKAMGNTSVGCLMSNHGSVCGGTSLSEAMYRAKRLENLCEVYLMTKGLEIVNMSEKEMEECRERDKSYGQAEEGEGVGHGNHGCC